MPDFSQKQIIKNLNLLLEKHHYELLDEDGVCLGLVANNLCRRYFGAKKYPFSLNYHMQMVKKITSYSQEQLLALDKDSDTFKEMIEFAERVRKLHQPQDFYFPIKQTELNLSFDLVKSIAGHIRCEYSFGSVLYEQEWVKVFKDIFKTISTHKAMVLFVNHDHAVGLYCENEIYYYYDPEETDAEVEIPLDSLINRLQDSFLVKDPLIPQSMYVFSDRPENQLNYPLPVKTLAEIFDADPDPQRINAQNKETGESALMVGAEMEAIEVCSMLLERDADANLPNSNGSLAIHKAAQRDNLPIVQLLSPKTMGGLDVENNRGETPLYCTAGEINLVRVLSWLLDNGVDVNKTTKTGNTALHFAAASSNVAGVLLLLARGADINAKNNDGYTPLMVAADFDSALTVGILLEKKADPEVKAIDGFTALTLALAKKHSRALEALIKSGFVSLVKEDNNCVLFDALQKYPVTIDHSVKNAIGDSFLSMETLHGHEAAILALLQKGANVNDKNYFGLAALHWAIALKLNNIPLICLLLDWGANPNIQDDWGFTPFMLAACVGEITLIEAMIKRSQYPINTTLKNFQGKTASMLAQELGHNSIVEYLQQAVIPVSTSLPAQENNLPSIKEICAATTDNDALHRQLESLFFRNETRGANFFKREQCQEKNQKTINSDNTNSSLTERVTAPISAP